MNKIIDNGAENYDKLQVYTLGQLLVTKGNRLLSEEYRQARKLWLLFSYIVVNQDKSLSTDELVEMLWPEFNENIDPEHALRNMIYRLRTLLNKGIKFDDPEQLIIYNRGAYRWNSEYPCEVDIRAFDSLIKEADSAASENQEHAIILFRKAVELYRGIFLPEYSDHSWVISLRNFYRKRYIESVLKLTGLVNSQGGKNEASEIFGKALLMEPFEEKLHTNYLYYLLDGDEYAQANEHYEFVTSLFYKELGIKPSQELQQIYKLIKSSEAFKPADNLQPAKTLNPRNILDAENCDGVIDCKPEEIPYYQQLKESRSSLDGQILYFIMFTLSDSGDSISLQNTKNGMSLLKEILRQQLRRGDVISHWNESQYIVLVSGVSKKQGQNVINRISNQFKEKSDIKNLRLTANISKAVINK